MSVYVLDTSALLAYIENEDGVTEVESVLIETLDDRHTKFLSTRYHTRRKIYKMQGSEDRIT